MKRNLTKLTLHRETLRVLEAPDLPWALGGLAGPESGKATCGQCNSVASCTQLKEDCCVTTVVAAGA
jgi:hypothetical protein